MKILFQLSGSIACYKACTVLSRLTQSGHDVRCAASHSALQFIGIATLEGLTGNAVATDTFAAGHAMEHIRLNQWADSIVLCPATANRLNKMAAGIGEDLLGNLWLTHDFTKPFFVVPAMNTKMWTHPTTQESLQKLEKMGVTLLRPNSGNLACGEVGAGRLLEPEEILEAILGK